MSIIHKSIPVQLLSANSDIEEIEKFLAGSGLVFVKLEDHKFYAGYMAVGNYEDDDYEIHFDDYVRMNDYFVSVDGVIWSQPQSIARLTNMGIIS